MITDRRCLELTQKQLKLYDLAKRKKILTPNDAFRIYNDRKAGINALKKLVQYKIIKDAGAYFQYIEQ